MSSTLDVKPLATPPSVTPVSSGVLSLKKNGSVPETITLPLEELQKFQATLLMAVGANMKRMLVVNDMCAIETRNLMRESILNEMNNLNRLVAAQLAHLCTPDSSKDLNASAQP